MTPDHAKRPRARLIRFFWIGYWIALFVATHLPRPPDITLGIEHGDIYIHFLTYFALTLLGGTNLRASRGSVPVLALFCWALVYSGYGVFDEWSQQFVDRSPALVDWLADVGGIVAATLVLSQSPREPRLSEPPNDPE